MSERVVDPLLSAPMARMAALDDKAAGQYARVNPDWLVVLIDQASADAGLRARVTALRDEMRVQAGAIAEEASTARSFDGDVEAGAQLDAESRQADAIADDLDVILAATATEETTPALEVERRDVWHDVLGCGERFHPEGSIGWQCPHPPIDGHEQRTVTPWKPAGGSS